MLIFESFYVLGWSCRPFNVRKGGKFGSVDRVQSSIQPTGFHVCVVVQESVVLHDKKRQDKDKNKTMASARPHSRVSNASEPKRLKI